MKKLVLICMLSIASIGVFAHNVIMSSCGTSVYIAEKISIEEAVAICEALDDACNR